MDCIPAVDQQQQFTNLTVQQFKSLACATVPGLQYDFNFPLLYLNLWLQKVYKSKNQSITLSLSHTQSYHTSSLGYGSLKTSGAVKDRQ